MKQEQDLNLEKDWEECKFTPISPFDILGMEQWLEELANQGLFPVHLGLIHCRFHHTGVPGTRFRLEPYGRDTEPTPEQLEMYAKAGWTYVMPVVRRTYFLFYTTDPEAPELYSDWSSRGMSLDRLTRRVRWLRMFWMFDPLIYFLMIGGIPLLFRGIQPELWPASLLIPIMLYLFKPLTLLLLLTFLSRILLAQHNCRVLVRTHRNLKHGLPPPPSPGWNKWIWLDNASMIPFMIVVCLVCFWTLKAEVGRELKEYTQPYISLAQIEQTPADRVEVPPGEGGVTGRVFKELSLIAPVWYRVEESAYEADPGTGSCPSARLVMVRLRLLIPPLARAAAEAELDLWREKDLSYDYEELEVPGLDSVLLARSADGSSQLAALSRGGWAAAFRYSGEENLRDHLELLASMVR